MRAFTQPLHRSPAPSSSTLVLPMAAPGRREVSLPGMASPHAGHALGRISIYPPDAYEREAERISESVMGMGEPAARAGRSGARLQAKHAGAGGPTHAAVPPVVGQALRTSGQPLDPAARAFMEPRFGHDFTHVRVHTDGLAAESARAVNALAYTVGDHVVFRAGEYAPGSPRGQRLLAHELAHVVQQGGGRALGGEPGLSPAPARLMRRKGPLSDQEEQKLEYDAARNAARRKHTDQQQHVADLMDRARKITPDPAKGFRDSDTLFRNSVELLDAGRFTLMVLTPTHYSTFDRPVYFDSRVFFNDRIRRPTRIGDYPDGALQNGPGLVQGEPGEEGRATAGAQMPQFTSISGAPLSTPPPAAPVFAAGLIKVQTDGTLIPEGQFRNTFVHEAQHVADLHSLALQKPGLAPWQERLEGYKTEFRAFWIQPQRPRTSALAPPMIDMLPEAKGKADNTRKVDVAGRSCTICAPAAGAPTAQATSLKNPRQEVIFWHLMQNYQIQEYACCYVYSKDFRKAVDDFQYPESVNLINSARLMELELELPNLAPSMTPAQVAGSRFALLLTRLEPLDWSYLGAGSISGPFWTALRAVAPKFVEKALNTLMKAGTKGPVSAADVSNALGVKPTP